MTQDIGSGRKAEIKMQSIHTSGGEVSRYDVNEMGQLVYVNGSYYLRFDQEDEDSEETIKTTIKFDEEDNVTIIRAGSEKTRMRFDVKNKTSMRYPTPAGTFLIDIDTRHVELQYKNNPFSGQINLEYQLATKGQILGNYNVTIQFTV